MESYIICPLCRHSDCTNNEAFSDMLDLINNTEARVKVCRRCELKFLFPYVAERVLSQMYSRSYFTGGSDDYETSFITGSGVNYDTVAQARLSKFTSSLDVIFKYVDSPRNMLDIGAATGEFLSFARQRGLSVSGIELSEHAARQAYERYGLILHVCKLEDFIVDDTYDIIHLNHVLEHFLDPHRAVSAIERLLSEKGVVYVEVPYQFNWVERVNYSCFGKKLRFNIHSIHHPIFFTPRTLVKLFEMHDMTPLILTVFNVNRYPAGNIMQLAKQFAWRVISNAKQGLFIEAVFARKQVR